MVKKGQRDKRLWKGVMWGAIAATLSTALICGAFALMITGGRAGEDQAGMLTALAAFIAAAIGSVTAWSVNREMAVPGGFLAALAVVLLRLVLTVAAGNGLGEGFISVTAGMLLGGTLPGFVLIKGKRRRR